MSDQLSLKEQYERNKMMIARDDHSYSDLIQNALTCTKCSHRIKGGQKFYRDVMSHLPAHITCPRKVLVEQKEAA